MTFDLPNSGYLDLFKSRVGIEALVYLHRCDEAPSAKAVYRALGRDRRAVRTRLKTLVERELVFEDTRPGRPGENSQSVNVYRLTREGERVAGLLCELTHERAEPETGVPDP